MDYFAGLDMSMDETRVSFSTPGRRNSREQKSRRQRRSRGVVEGAEMPPHCLPFAPDGLRGTEGRQGGNGCPEEAPRGR